MTRPDQSPRSDSPSPSLPLTILKIGGGLSADAPAFARIGEAAARFAAGRRVVVVPGGGPFADGVRDFDRAHGLSASAAHWMAILAMDQYAWALADRIPGSTVVEDRAGIAAAEAARQLPVLAPARWLRAADELPHDWGVTSDSLAAYLATLLGAEQLVVVKPVAGGRELLDPWFERTLPAGLAWRVVGIDDFLGEVLR